LAGARPARAARRGAGRGQHRSRLAGLSEHVRCGPSASRWRLRRAGARRYLETL
jgi:hypothetical protein